MKNSFLEIITCVSSIYTIDYPDFIVCYFYGKSYGLKRDNKTVAVAMFLSIRQIDAVHAW